MPSRAYPIDSNQYVWDEETISWKLVTDFE
jgi:hypothetical protein